MTAATKTKRVFDHRFEILAIVGRGAQSVVYHARHMLIPSQEVAIKVLINLPKPGKKVENLHDKLRKEALAMVSARHRYVIRIDDFHTIDDICYLSMEYAEEGDLRRYVKKHGGKLSPAQAELFFRQSAEGLNFVHKAGILHRDLKPENILVMNEREIRLADFGVAVLPGEAFSVQDLQAGVGTMDYMAPEVLEGKQYRESADIYGLAVSFYELLTGTHPFANMPLIKQLEARHDSNIRPISELVPGLSENFVKTLTRCLAYDHNERFQSCFDVLEGLSGRFRATKSKVEAPIIIPAITEIANTHSQQDEQIVNAAETVTFEASDQEIIEPLDDNGSNIAPLTSNSTLETPQVERIENPFAKPEISQAVEPMMISKSHSPDAMMLELGSKKTVSLPREVVDQVTRPNNNNAEEQVGVETVIGGINSEVAKEPKVSIPVKTNLSPETFKAIANATKQSNSAFSSTFLKVIVTAICIFGVYKIWGFWQTQAVEEISNEIIPNQEIKVDKSILENFPLLPAGIYRGEIKDLIPGITTPLIMVYHDKSVAVILGLEGWTAREVDLSGVSPGSFSVSSNGIILRLNAESIESDELRGNFINRTAAGKGSWKIKIGGR